MKHIRNERKNDDDEFEVWVDRKNKIVSFHALKGAECLKIDRQTFFEQYLQGYFNDGYRFQ